MMMINHPSARSKRHRIVRYSAIAAILAFGSASAQLLNRGGGLIYDTQLKVTWLQDANYARTSGAHPTGRMTFKQARAWAASLAYFDAVRGVTLTGWRLPKTRPVNGVSFDWFGLGPDGSGMVNGGSDVGYWISAPGSVFAGSKGSELAHLHYSTLRNRAYCGQPGFVGTASCDTVSPNPLNMGFGWGGTPYVFNNGPFTNLVSGFYWGGDLPSPRTAYPDRGAFGFNFGIGLQHAYDTKTTMYVWAVRDGDVTAVASPPTTPPPAVPTNPTLSVKTAGGKGLVKSDTGGIDCGKSCSTSLPAGTVVRLTATPEPGVIFVNWSGACVGTVPVCTVALGGSKSVTANFNK